MYKVDLPVDNSVALAVERRRAAEAARQSRIFNPRNRVIGLDLQALDQQAAERREREEREKESQKAYDALRVTNDHMLEQSQREEEERRREQMKDLVQFRATYQRPEHSRDADLTCDRQGALALNLSIPESLGPASMQVFKGEDLGEKERKRAQIEETERQLRAQREDTEKLRLWHKHEELQQDKYLVQQDLRSAHLQALEEEGKRVERLALTSFNQFLAEERAARERREREQNIGMAMAEIRHMVTSDLLTECPEAAERALWPGWGQHVLTDRWRGMTAEQRAAILREQEQQRLEREKQREAERQREKAWDQERLEQARALEEKARREHELDRQRKMELARHNQQLAQEQQQHQQYLDKQLYTNQPAVSYFTQFNTSSR
ncbi:RIB43A-like with coiled-coils protein 1 [Alosa sapidissima]|uniref:RIB43A-like with coiled-coils protein 1 n=1 Tax=Alosa sapidissima TaxID=34773 RepID=UPI001C087931|nr:RIB43A-like with coiled-coils protein 1 [Alosa sapidissima]